MSQEEGDVVRLGASARVSPAPRPCAETRDECWLALPIPLTPQQV